MTVLWTAAEAQAATGGVAVGVWRARGIAIDSRAVRPGDLFVALKDRRDGHDFVAAALAGGAAAALVSQRPDGVAGDAPLLIVDDVLAALWALGAAGRARSRAKVIAVTGSVGKTSTKDMLRCVLAGQGRVHAAEASFNNQWGVPLTLARLPADADFAVIEIGMNHPGEIAPLARLARPDVALITTIAGAHLEAFEDLAAIAQEKAAVFQGVADGGQAVIPGDLDTSAILIDAARTAGATVRRFGWSAGNECRLEAVTLSQNATVANARVGDVPVLFKLSTPGRHFAENACGVFGVVAALGADLALAATDIARWRPPAGRGTIERLVLDSAEEGLCIDLIDDAFNANPTSLAAAFEVLGACQPADHVGRISAGRKVAILGDMLELGPDELAQHRAIADLPAAREIDLFHCVGPLMAALYERLPPDRRGLHSTTADRMAEQAHRLIDAGDVVLVKGSKGSRVSLVVDAIRKLGHPQQTQTEGP